MTPDEFYNLAVDRIDDYRDNYREGHFGEAGIRQWWKRLNNYTVLMTEHRSVRKVTFTARNARISMIDRAYWTTESGVREAHWQKRPPSDEEIMTALLMLS